MIRLLFCCLLFTAIGFAAEADWQKLLAERIPAYGHRNWIVIADSAYPAQAKDGIETVVANATQIEVLRFAMAALSKSKHVAPVIHTDTELNYLDDNVAPGIEAYRSQLAGIFGTNEVHAQPHEKIIERLDEVSKTFKVLIIKTNMTLPYTSVFLQLDCAYWGPDAEKGLRSRMAAAGVH